MTVLCYAFYTLKTPKCFLERLTKKVVFQMCCGSTSDIDLNKNSYKCKADLRPYSNLSMTFCHVRSMTFFRISLAGLQKNVEYE